MNIPELIEGLRQQARQFRANASLLEKSADALEAQIPQTPILHLTTIEGATTRKDQIKKYLEANGPTSRRDLVEKAGFKGGTLANVLLDTETFERKRGGLWAVKIPAANGDGSGDGENGQD